MSLGTYTKDGGKMTITVEVEISNKEIANFGSLIRKAFILAMEFGRTLVVQALEIRDQELAEVRDKKRYRNKGKRQTSIKTKLGIIEFSRNVYIDNAAPEGEKCVYLLDEDLEIEKVGLVSEDICQAAATAVCESTYRGAAKMISETTGLSISGQGVWNIIQELGEGRKAQIDRQAEQAEAYHGTGVIESKLLYEENDGIYLKLQGKSRQKFGSSKEMKVGIAYDGATWEIGKGKKKRRTLDCKVAYASFENAKDFMRNKEGLVASRYNTDEIKLRVINGDGAQWIQKHGDTECISVLDKFHRNKKITECVRDPEFAALVRELLYAGRTEDALNSIKAQIDSVMDTQEKEALKELYCYYDNNKSALLGYYDRGIAIPETRKPGEIHHARLGSMEGNVFTLIGNRMKGRRACWSEDGANHLALILCAYHTTGLEGMFTDTASGAAAANDKQDYNPKASAGSTPETVGHGYCFYNSGTISAKWARHLDGVTSFTEMSYA